MMLLPQAKKKKKNESTSHKKNRNFISTHTLRKAEKET